MFDYELKRRRRNKRIVLRVSNENKVLVSAPFSASNETIDDFVRSCSEWINNQILKNNYKRLSLTDGETIFFRGKELSLRLFISDRRISYARFDEGNELHLMLKRADMELPKELRSDRIRSLVQNLFKKEAKDILTQRSRHFSSLLGLTFNKVRVKSLSSRWGSCSNMNNLNFNWKVILCPPEYADYLIVHELCHLRHRNHSAEFWAEVSKILPDYKRLRKALKQNASSYYF